MSTTLHFVNYGLHGFRGWRRCIIEAPKHYYVPSVATVLDHDKKDLGIKIVFAHAYGELNRLWAVDVWSDLPGGTDLKIQILGPTQDRHPLESLPLNPLQVFGTPTMGGYPMELVDCGQDGAAWKFALRLRPRTLGQESMFCWRVWLRWYPEHQGWMEGEILLTCSNCGLPYLTATTPFPTQLEFQGKQTVTRAPGWPLGADLLPAGSMLGDGQARSWPILVAWLDQIKAPFENLASLDAGLIAGHGVQDLYYPAHISGSPNPKPSKAFWQQNVDAVRTALGAWNSGPLGVAQNSGQTGGQEDQVFVGGEALDPVCAQLRYWTGLTQLRRPCHHLEEDGNLISLGSRPELMLWDGRPLWISKDQLGKPRNIQPQEAHNWWGPDVEHWLINSMVIGAQITDSDALQFGLEAQAMVYLYQWTVAPGLSTSQTYASRAVGWECFAVLHLIRTLRNRAIANAVRTRWISRLQQIIVAQHGSIPPVDRPIWDVRVDDGRLGPGPRWIPWQQAVEAAGLFYSARYILDQSIDDQLGLRLHSMAVAGASTVVDCGWRFDGHRWQTNPSGLSTIDGGGGSWDESFNFFGMSLAPAILVASLPADTPIAVKSRQIWDQLIKTDPTNTWLMPGIR